MKAWDAQENLSGTERVRHTRYPVAQPTEIVMTQDLQEALDLLESLHGRDTRRGGSEITHVERSR